MEDAKTITYITTKKKDSISRGSSRSCTSFEKSCEGLKMDSERGSPPSWCSQTRSRLYRLPSTHDSNINSKSNEMPENEKSGNELCVRLTEMPNDMTVVAKRSKATYTRYS
jgi:hypothetical protein